MTFGLLRYKEGGVTDAPVAVDSTPIGNTQVMKLDFGAESANSVASDENPFPMKVQKYAPISWGTPVSTAVTTAVEVVAANANRKALFVYCASGSIYFRYGANPTSGVYMGILNAGQSLPVNEGANSQQSFCCLSLSGTATVLTSEAA